MISFFTFLGQLYHLVSEVVVSLVKGKFYWSQLMKQIVEIGFRSQLVVVITGAFIGAVLSAQAIFQMETFKMETMAGALVSVAMLRELGPTVTALMLAGRVGASMAAEIGTMNVTEQVDALRSMDVHPIDYLVTPRFIAMAIAMPLLIAESVGFGILSSIYIGTEVFGIDLAYYSFHIDARTEMEDIIIAMVKGTCFGMLIVIISCHQGMNAKNGAVGVGRGTTSAMVNSSLAVLMVNYFLTLILNSLFPLGVV